MEHEGLDLVEGIVREKCRLEGMWEETYNSMEFASFVAYRSARLSCFVLSCAELAEVFGGFGVGFAEEVEFYAA